MFLFKLKLSKNNFINYLAIVCPETLRAVRSKRGCGRRAAVSGLRQRPVDGGFRPRPVPGALPCERRTPTASIYTTERLPSYTSPPTPCHRVHTHGAAAEWLSIVHRRPEESPRTDRRECNGPTGRSMRPARPHLEVSVGALSGRPTIRRGGAWRYRLVLAIQYARGEPAQAGLDIMGLTCEGEVTNFLIFFFLVIENH